MSTYDNWKADEGDTDPDGVQAERDAEADEQVAHPERYAGVMWACDWCSASGFAQSVAEARLHICPAPRSLS